MANMTKLDNQDDVFQETLSADGTLEFPLKRGRQWAKSVTVDARGAFGGGTLAALATGDGTNYVALLDANGNAIVWTADDFKQMMESGFGPFMTGQLSLTGAAGPSVVVTALVRYE